MAAEAGIKPWEAEHQTPADILISVEGHHNNQVHDMRQTRVIAYTIAAANRDPKKSFPKMEQFMPLPGDPGKKKRAASSPKDVFASHREKMERYKQTRAKRQ